MNPPLKKRYSQKESLSIFLLKKTVKKIKINNKFSHGNNRLIAKLNFYPVKNTTVVRILFICDK